MLAKEARTRELDDSPDFGLLRQRAEETVLQTLLQRDLTRNLPDSTKEDARNYVASHPDLFRQRKLFAVEQLRMVQIGRAHVCTTVPNAHHVCRLLLEKKKET